MTYRYSVMIIPFLLFLLAACTPPPTAISSLQINTVPYGKIETPDVVIVDQQGTFRLESGVRFQPPFQLTAAPHWTKSGMVNSYQNALRLGARHVRVTVPGEKQPLFGVLSLNQIPAFASGPASRSYLIRIPQQYISEARGGRISVVYEPLNVRLPAKLATDLDFQNNRDVYAGWILWLSDMPLDSAAKTGLH